MIDPSSAHVAPDDAPGQAGEAERPPKALTPKAPNPKALTPAAQRALAEAEARRAAIDRKAAAAGGSPERGGRGGLDPVRYDDWEIAGRAVDF